MSNIDVFSMAVRNLLKRKLRTSLTALGIVIGVALVTLTISLSIGVNKNLVESLSRMSDLLTVNVYYYSNAYYGGGVVVLDASSSGSSSDELILDDKAIESFKAMPGVLTATAFVDVNVKAVSGKLQNWLNLRGIDPETLELLGYTLKEGTLFTGEEKYEAVFGYNPPYDFYNPRDRNREWTYWWPGSGEEDTRIPPVDIFNDKIQFSYDWNFGEKSVLQDPNRKPVKPYKMRVVGRFDYNGNTDYQVYMPLDDVLEIKEAQDKWQNSQEWNQRGGSGNKNKSPQGYQNALVKFTDIKYVEDGINSIRNMGFEAYGMASTLSEMQNIVGSIQMVFGVMGGFALLVSAIGVANTMYMSIHERTREIGIMKAIGATIKDIRRLFLLEAALLGFLGGLIGMGVSLGGSAAINHFGIAFFDQLTYSMDTGGVSDIPLWLALSAVGGAMLMGMLAGFLPARRAMKLSALAAIREE